MAWERMRLSWAPVAAPRRQGRSPSEVKHCSNYSATLVQTQMAHL